jgi:hypothetical protein
LKKPLLILVGIVAFVGLLAYMTLGMKQHRVEVCMEYREQKNCRTASGPTREAALRTATENACATISSGMTESVNCGSRPPVSVRWLDASR